MGPPMHRSGSGEGGTFSTSVDIDSLIEKSKCAGPYLELEKCLVDSNRNWSKCQQFVKALKICNDKPSQQISTKEVKG